METVESENKPPKQKKLLTSRLTLVSALLLILTVAAMTSEDASFIPKRFHMLLFPLSFLLTLVSSLAGFVIGFFALKKNKRQALFGIIGHSFALMFLLSIEIVKIGISQFGPP